MRARCWSPEDRLLIAERVRKNDTGIQNKEFKVRSPSHFTELNVVLIRWCFVRSYTKPVSLDRVVS